MWPVFICNLQLCCTQWKGIFVSRAPRLHFTGQWRGRFKLPVSLSLTLPWLGGTPAPPSCSGTLIFFLTWPTFSKRPCNSGGSRHPACCCHCPAFGRHHQLMKASSPELDDVSTISVVSSQGSHHQSTRIAGRYHEHRFATRPVLPSPQAELQTRV